MARTARTARQGRNPRPTGNNDGANTSSTTVRRVVRTPYDHLLLAADECKECIDDDPESENCVVCTSNFTAVNETQCCGKKCICTACYKEMYSDDNNYQPACTLCRTPYIPLKDLKLIKVNKDWENAVNDILSNQHVEREEMTATVNKLKADLEQRDQLIVCKDKELMEKMEIMKKRGNLLIKTQEENIEMKKVMRGKTNLEKKPTRKEVTDENLMF